MVSTVSSTQTPATATGLTQAANTNSQVSKDQFLLLLTEQLKNQDPMKPYDNQEFASQLAQFSQLEQLTSINTLLEQQATSNQNLSKTISNSALPGMLGKTAKAQSDTVNFDGSNSMDFGYSLPYGAALGLVTITDPSGAVVKQFNLSGSKLTAGDQKLNWDGKDNRGNMVNPGNYKFTVQAIDSTGADVQSTSYTYGKIQSVRFKPEGTMLLINGVEAPLENVVDISS